MTISGDPHPPPEPRPAARVAALRASSDSDGATTVIHLAGSLRCATAPALREAVDAVLGQRPATIVLNLAELHADDELGLWVLPAMAGDVARHGAELVIAAPYRALRVRLRRLGGHQLDIIENVPATS